MRVSILPEPQPLPAKAGVPIFPIGVGSERLPAQNVRMADFVAPARAFPGDRFGGHRLRAGPGTRREARRRSNSPNSRPTRRRQGGRRCGERPSRPAHRCHRSAARRRRRIGGRRDSTCRACRAPAAAPDDARGAAGRRSFLSRRCRRSPELVERRRSDRAGALLLGERTERGSIHAETCSAGPDRASPRRCRAGHGRGGRFAEYARRTLAAFPDSAEALDAYDVVVAFELTAGGAAGPHSPPGPAGAPGGRGDPGGLRARRRQRLHERAGWPYARTQIIRGLHPGWNSSRGQPLLRAQWMTRRQISRAHAARFHPRRAGGRVLVAWIESHRQSGRLAYFPASTPAPLMPRRPSRGHHLHASPAACRSSGGEPIHMAGQFYGRAACSYSAAENYWRLRSLDDALFDARCTQLVRHVSQGRLLRGSSRAALLAHRDRFAVGSRRAGAGRRPGRRSAPTTARGTATGPDGTVIRVPFAADPADRRRCRGPWPAARDRG